MFEIAEHKDGIKTVCYKERRSYVRGIREERRSRKPEQAPDGMYKPKASHAQML